MRTHDSWQPLSARIRGLTEAGQFAANLFGSHDSSRVIGALADHGKAIFSDLINFADSLEKGESLKNADAYAREAIDRVKKEAYPLLTDDGNGNTDMRRINVRTALVLLAALEGEVTYILRDGQEGIRSLTERAFEHLNRTIVVDEGVRAKWKDAYERHETACEALGGVHLLSHGIWAFKAKGPKAETDLVYQEPPTDIGRIKRSSDGLVLTEWKRLTINDDPAKLFESARKQAELYVGGVLGGMELRKYRYAVLVTQNAVSIPTDLEIGDVIYRHINVVVEPTVPSKQTQSIRPSR
jgi:hypothetical protein